MTLFAEIYIYCKSDKLYEISCTEKYLHFVIRKKMFNGKVDILLFNIKFAIRTDSLYKYILVVSVNIFNIKSAFKSDLLYKRKKNLHFEQFFQVSLL